MDLGVLSAENYQERAYSQMQTAEGGENNQLYGGLLVNHEESSSGPVSRKRMKTRDSSKKVTSTNASADEVSHQRGRPRLDTRDRNAAERRRTQIRLAQRAYRQRKETTIDGLNKRVKSLEQTILHINRAFLDFNDKAIASTYQNWEPSLAESLEKTALRFVELTNNASHESNLEMDEPASSLPPDVLSSREVQPELRSRGLADQRLPMNTVTAPSGIQPISVWGYQATFEDPGGKDDGENIQLSSTQRANRMPTLGRDATEDLQLYQTKASEAQSYRHENEQTQFHGIELLDPLAIASIAQNIVSSLEVGLLSPSSYDFQETSFARRLIRHSVQFGYRLLTNPGSRPEDIARICRFTFCFSNVTQIIEHMQMMMVKTTKDNMEFWDCPQYHLGGAGLHYPRIGIDASTAPPAWWADKAPMGPRRFLHPATPVSNDTTISQIIERVGFDGEWFDANDVEQYLRTKGLYLDGQSSIVEINDPKEAYPHTLPEIYPPGVSSSDVSSSRDTGSGPRSPQNAHDMPQGELSLQSTDYAWNEDAVSMPIMSDTGMDLALSEPYLSGSKSSGPFFDPVPGLTGYPDLLPTFNLKAKKFVDMDVFLNTIVKSGVCLGRTPGYRRAAVDTALTMATLEVF